MRPITAVLALHLIMSHCTNALAQIVRPGDDSRGAGGFDGDNDGSGRETLSAGGFDLETGQGPSVDNLAADMKQLIRQMDALQQQLNSLSGSGGSVSTLGTMLPAVKNNPEVRRELSRAVQGRVIIHNDTGDWVPIYVNGVQWRARPDESFVWQTVGNVAVSFSDDLNRVTHLDDWKFNDQTGFWELVVDIPFAGTRTTARKQIPDSSTFQQPPNHYDSRSSYGSSGDYGPTYNPPSCYYAPPRYYSVPSYSYYNAYYYPSYGIGY